MKHLNKKLFSLFLAAVMLFALSSPAFASAECACGQEPIIYVAALGSATLYQNAGTQSERVVFRPETSTYVKMAAQLVLPLFRLCLTRNYDAFATSLIAAAGEVFGPLANQPYGTSTPDITTKRELPTDATHSLDTNYYFGYDFRADPLVVAQQLDEYIDAVRELTGHEKVRLRASSMGGVMTMAYIEQFGTAKIKSIIFQCCPIKGTAVAGDLFCGKIEITRQAVYRYASLSLPLMLDGAQEKAVMGLVNVLDKTGVLSHAINAINRLVDAAGDRVFNELLIPVFSANCGIWSFVPDEYYEQAKDFMLGSNPNTQLEKRIDSYHYNVQCKADEILNRVVNSGVPVMVLAAYNMQRTPLVPAWRNDSDGTVDTAYASVGATVALLGETLPTSYTQAVNDGHNHLSPDGRIDASTCALPEHTWFVRDMLHCNTHDGHRALYRWFYENDNNPQVLNVFSNPAYPQFLQNDVDAKTLTPQ